MSGARTVYLDTHFETAHSFRLQVYGTDEYTLYPPADHESLYVFPSLHPFQSFSQANLDHPDLSRFPRLSTITPFTTTLSKGELLYIPPYWYVLQTSQPIA